MNDLDFYSNINHTKLQPICPGCNKPILQYDNGFSFFFFNCSSCPTKMLIDKKDEILDSYYYEISFKGKKYSARFQVVKGKDFPFVIEFYNQTSKVGGSWEKILELNYLPKLTYQQFKDKLPIWLLFL